MLMTTRPTGGEDEYGFYLLARFNNEDPDQVQEMLGLLNHPDGIAEVVERSDAEVVLKIRPDLPGL